MGWEGMSLHYMRDETGAVTAVVTLANIYEFRGFVFEFHPYLGPVKLRKSDHEEAARTGRKFWKVFEEWDKLSKEEKEETRIFG
jgi:hypothetical protein